MSLKFKPLSLSGDCQANEAEFSFEISDQRDKLFRLQSTITSFLKGRPSSDSGLWSRIVVFFSESSVFTINLNNKKGNKTKNINKNKILKYQIRINLNHNLDAF